MPEELTGRGCFAAVIDSGIDYAHPAFRDTNGRTRIFALWDQTNEGNPPPGFSRGTVYDQEQINRALEQRDIGERRRMVPSSDNTGHGTHVAGILAASCFPAAPMCGVAPEAELLVVKLGNEIDYQKEAYGISDYQLIEAVLFVLQISEQEGKPVGINLSYGNSKGPHTGMGPLSSFLNGIMLRRNCVICIGTGNEGNTGRHASGILSKLSGSLEEIPFALNVMDSAPQISLWSYGRDEFYLELSAPDGSRSDRILVNENLVLEKEIIFKSFVRILYLPPTPLNQETEVRISFGSPDTEEDKKRFEGIWTLRLISFRIVNGEYDLWMSSGGTAGNSRFLRPETDRTLTVPGDAYMPVAVGGYQENTGVLAPFSGRGYTRSTRIVKPDVVAPAVDILSAAPGGGYTRKSGTSMAVPCVTGLSILRMQWGIINGNDPLMYGQKVKAWLLKNAEKLPAYSEYPNPETGWGAVSRFTIENR